MPAPTGSTTIVNTIGTVRVARCNAAADVVVVRQDDIRRERNQFRRVFAMPVAVARRAPADVDPDVATVGPTQLLQSLHERPEADLAFRAVRGEFMSTPMRRTRSTCCARTWRGHEALPPRRRTG